MVKHAEARRCSVRVDRDGHLVRVSIDDDGRGLTASAAQPSGAPSSGVGIASARARLEEVGGSLEIVSSAAGTSVRAAIPVHRPTLGTGSNVDLKKSASRDPVVSGRS